MEHFTEATEQLFRKFAENSCPQAYEALYQLLAEEVYNYCLKILQIHQIAEDVMHDIFINISVKQDALKQADNATAYFYRMVRNTVYDYLRTQNKRNEILSRLGELQPTSIDPLGILFQKEQELHLQEGIKNLSPRQQAVFSLCKMEGLSYRETGTLLHLSGETVKHHLKNCYKHLRTYVKGLNDPEQPDTSL